MRLNIISALAALSVLPCSAQRRTQQTSLPDIETHRIYLSGQGCDDTVMWDFSISDGRRAGEKSQIAVPSCWELQGFGTYQYGMRFYGKAHPDGIANEKGHYHTEFTLPEEWSGRHIDLIFEGVMTDMKAQINNRRAVALHQGGFYRITQDVSDRIYFGKKKNTLDVDVSKESANDGVNLSERRADYWNFGGIFRPVFIESKPAICIERTAIDAQADGNLTALVIANKAIEGASVHTIVTTENGNQVGEISTPFRKGSDRAEVRLKAKNIEQWTAETPCRYLVTFTLKDAAGKALHVTREKIGFRTIETREHDGLYINGRRVLVKGVNRHSFRPETGRTLSKAKNIEDVELIKSMNMNAVRLSHYPADPEFYEACDSLGLYVMDELTGWHGHHETIVGQNLVREMVCRDVNHPSIIWWSNGNEGGWNTELDGEFHKWDIQKRPVIHPQGNFGGYETMHYRSYGESNNYMRKPEIWMPTEFLHALYDGGAGAGLHDYWEVMRKWPRCAGGFIWALVDEGVCRTDMPTTNAEGKTVYAIDNVGNFGADGIVGPHYEKEGSYFAIRQIWSPVVVSPHGHQYATSIDKDFDGTLDIENRYDFVTLEGTEFSYSYDNFSPQGRANVLRGKVAAPSIPARQMGQISIPMCLNADVLTISAIDNKGHEIFSWTLWQRQSALPQERTATKAQVTDTDAEIVVEAGETTYTFDKTNGRLKELAQAGRKTSFANGPQFVAYKRADRSMDQFYNHDDPDAEKRKTTYTAYPDLGHLSKISQTESDGDTIIVSAEYELGSLERVVWRIAPNGEARMTYTYTFNGVVDIMGVSFDMDENEVASKKWLGQGPYRIWKNRTQGPQLGVYENEYNDPIPAETYAYPEFKGYFGQVQWMYLRTTGGPTIRIAPRHPQGETVGVFRPRDGRDELLYTLPETGISVLQVAPAVRNKVNTTDLNGPSAQPVWAAGQYTGEIIISVF